MGDGDGDGGTLMSTVSIEAIDPREVRCIDCEEEAKINTKLTVFGETSFFAARSAGEKNGPEYHETDDGWLCDGCRSTRQERRRELLKRPKQGPPEPPDEWRFCQSCGDQIHPHRLDGQYCSGCAGSDT